MPYRTAVPADPRSKGASAAPQTEEGFRDLLDEAGVLRPGAMSPPDRGSCYAVFSQRPDACLEVESVRRHAARFFAAKVGLTVDKRYGDAPPQVDAARVVLATDDGTASGTRLCYARPSDASDQAAAEAAERAQATSGLALLAARCPTLWLVVPEAEDDRTALTLAAIFASTMLGPILQPGGQEIFGVRTARLKLEGRSRPYR